MHTMDIPKHLVQVLYSIFYTMEKVFVPNSIIHYAA